MLHTCLGIWGPVFKTVSPPTATSVHFSVFSMAKSGSTAHLAPAGADCHNRDAAGIHVRLISLDSYPEDEGCLAEAVQQQHRMHVVVVQRALQGAIASILAQLPSRYRSTGQSQRVISAGMTAQLARCM